MLLQFTSTDASGKPAPKQLGVFKKWTRVTIQVLTNGQTVSLGDSLADITGSPIAGVAPGLQFTQSNTVPPQQLWWKGELWGIGSSTTIASTVMYFHESGSDKIPD